MLVYTFKNLNQFLLKISFVLFLSKQVVEKREVQADFSPEFITKTLPRLEWPAIYEAAQLVSYIKINKFGFNARLKYNIRKTVSFRESLSCIISFSLIGQHFFFFIYS